MKRQVIAVMGVLAFSAVALAARPEGPGRREGGRGPGPGRPGPKPLKEELQLTDAQAAQLKKLHSDQQKASIRRRADMGVARLELRDLLDAATVDEKAVALKVKELSDLQAAALKARVDAMLAMKKVLTPEQQEKMKELRARHPRRGPRPAAGPRFERRPPRGPMDDGEEMDMDDGGPDEPDDEPPLTPPEAQ